MAILSGKVFAIFSNSAINIWFMGIELINVSTIPGPAFVGIVPDAAQIFFQQGKDAVISFHGFAHQYFLAVKILYFLFKGQITKIIETHGAVYISHAYYFPFVVHSWRPGYVQHA